MAEEKCAPVIQAIAGKGLAGGSSHRMRTTGWDVYWMDTLKDRHP